MQPMESWKTIIGGIVIVAIIGFTIGFLVRGIFTPRVSTSGNTIQRTQGPLIGTKQTPMPTPKGNNQNNAPTIVPQAVVSNSGNIKVFAPFTNDLISNPFKLEGEARVFENVLNFRLSDVSGNIISEGNLTADAKDVGKFGKFEAKVEFSKTSDVGTLEVFSLSPKDGSEINMVEIPLNFE